VRRERQIGVSRKRLLCLEDGKAAFLLVIGKKFSESIKFLDKAKTVVRRRRNATGLKEEAGMRGKRRLGFLLFWTRTVQ
jgi:hypothetical protein